jgi:hypothetical protein
MVCFSFTDRLNPASAVNFTEKPQHYDAPFSRSSLLSRRRISREFKVTSSIMFALASLMTYAADGEVE